MIFGIRNQSKFYFHFDENNLEVTDCLKYLGVIF